MRQFLAAGAVVALLSGCTASGGTATSVTPTTVCQAVANAQANATVQSTMAPQVAANTAVGQLWQYLQSGCSANQPAAGVNASWTQEVMTMLENALPTVLPALVGLI